MQLDSDKEMKAVIRIYPKRRRDSKKTVASRLPSIIAND